VATLLDGRSSLVVEDGRKPAELIAYLREAIGRITKHPGSEDALAGYLLPDAASRPAMRAGALRCSSIRPARAFGRRGSVFGRHRRRREVVRMRIHWPNGGIATGSREERREHPPGSQSFVASEITPRPRAG
jgi:hypothetical protein